VEQMRADGFGCHVAASVDELRIANGSLDVVSVLDCNYYWPNQIPELRAIRRKLQPGGLLVVRVVDKSWTLNVDQRSDEKNNSFRYRKPRMRTRFCLRTTFESFSVGTIVDN
jgi:SAM-dependent methyltransferase